MDVARKILLDDLACVREYQTVHDATCPVGSERCYIHLKADLT